MNSAQETADLSNFQRMREVELRAYNDALDMIGTAVRPFVKRSQDPANVRSMLLGIEEQLKEKGVEADIRFVAVQSCPLLSTNDEKWFEEQAEAIVRIETILSSRDWPQRLAWLDIGIGYIAGYLATMLRNGMYSFEKLRNAHGRDASGKPDPFYAHMIEDHYSVDPDSLLYTCLFSSEPRSQTQVFIRYWCLAESLARGLLREDVRDRLKTPMTTGFLNSFAYVFTGMGTTGDLLLPRDKSGCSRPDDVRFSLADLVSSSHTLRSQELALETDKSCVPVARAIIEDARHIAGRYGFNAIAQ